jgi:hypothetical protein
VRVAGDLATSPLRATGAVGNVVSIALFILTAAALLKR